MNKIRIALATATFMLAISGAFASKLFFADDGYTKKADVPGQTETCKFRASCAGGTATCTFNIGGTDYNLYKTATSCVTLLTQP